MATRAGVDWPLSSGLVLGALPTAASCGRLHAKNVVWEWGLGYLSDTIELLVSELLTNALRASESIAGPDIPPIRLRLFSDRTVVLLEVWDHNPDDPQPRDVDAESESGRGFSVIEALSSRWGFRRLSYSLKVVWCELLIGDRATGTGGPP
jgi:anti-sigma regulatory factor (Ser/Thr protein kinase)